MTEDDARQWIYQRFGEAAVERLELYAQLLTEESVRQNLVAASTLPMLWSRHFADSAQLVGYAPTGIGEWIDIGAGAGLPGLVVAIVSDWRITLVEPRRLRASFLAQCIDRLGLGHRVTVETSKIEAVRREVPAAVVSARAVAALPRLIASAKHLADLKTVWLLPKGVRAESEVADARHSWQGVFHVKQSLVDPDSGIVVASQVARRR